MKEFKVNDWAHCSNILVWVENDYDEVLSSQYFDVSDLVEILDSKIDSTLNNQK